MPDALIDLLGWILDNQAELAAVGLTVIWLVARRIGAHVRQVARRQEILIGFVIKIAGPNVDLPPEFLDVVDVLPSALPPEGGTGRG